MNATYLQKLGQGQREIDERGYMGSSLRSFATKDQAKGGKFESPGRRGCAVILVG